MADITLYGVAVSAFVAKVRIVLDLKGLAYDERTPPDGYGSPAYRAIVPAGSVPGVVVDGRALHDSNAIVEYLEEIAPGPRLMPRDPYRRAKTRALLGFHDTRLEASVRALFPLVKTNWRDQPEAVKAGAAGIEAALERLDQLISPRPFVHGDTLSLADIAYPCTLQMASLLAAEMNAPVSIPPEIAAWRDDVAKVDAVSRSLRIAGEAMEDWMAGFRR